MTATYTKLSKGDWGVRIPRAHNKGDNLAVEVTKKNGQKKVEDVRVIWSGKDRDGGDVSLAVIQKGQRSRADGYDRKPRFAEDEGSSFPCHVCGKFCYSGDNGYCPEER